MLALFHPECSAEVLSKNVCSPAWEERYAIAQNPKTPNTILTQLTKDSNRWVRAISQQNLEARV